MTKIKKYFLISLTVLLLALSACSKSSDDWQEKYQGCKVLASLLAQDAKTSSFFEKPDCEQIPKLCSSNPASAECKKELGKYSKK